MAGWARVNAPFHETTRRFGDDDSGTVAIEFAMVGSLVIALILETMQGGLFLYQQAALERATASAARQIMVGNASTSSLTSAQFQTQIVCASLPAAMSCANISLDSEVVSQDVAPNGFYAFAKSDMSGLVPMPSQSATTFCTGASGSVVYLRVSYTGRTLSPAWTAIAKANGTTLNGAPAYRVTSYAAFRNEPFQGSGSGC